jgi:hypothetical protein
VKYACIRLYRPQFTVVTKLETNPKAELRVTRKSRPSIANSDKLRRMLTIAQHEGWIKQS